MGQAQLRKEIKDQKDKKIEMGSFIPGCKIPTVETVKHVAKSADLSQRVRIEEAEKKLAITVFSFPLDKGNVGTAAYLNMFSSIYSVLKDLKRDGYNATKEKVGHIGRRFPYFCLEDEADFLGAVLIGI